MEALEHEHRHLDQLLDTVELDDANDRRRFIEAVEELHHHIAKEEDGLFPASLTALTGDDWNQSIAAWHKAHPNARTP
ncbi:hemerythrin domain-containing protein [Streptomyces sp. NPDC059881]|uniref:hemerythrin domain-containing protein n=1 Tax=Streptomyces sp. NPDC059881 TaxID=3346986 RepID=UPI003656ED54